MGKWLHDWGPLVVAVAALTLSILSYLRAGRALRLGGSSAVARLEQLPPGRGSMFRLVVTNKGRSDTTVEWVAVENDAGRSRSLDHSHDRVDFGGHVLPKAPLPALRTIEWELGPDGILQLLARDEDKAAEQSQLTHKIRCRLTLGDGTTVKTPWATYDWSAG